MAENYPNLTWPGADDRAVVEEMQRDSTSAHWDDCYELVRKLVQLRAKNIPQDQWDDIMQDAILRTRKSLLTFQFQCRFKNWVFNIVGTTVIDAHRRHKRIEQFTTSLSDSHDDTEYDGDAHFPSTSRSVEEECIILVELEEAIVALREYLSSHVHTERNSRIVDIVIFEGRSLEEAAKAAGCSSPVAGYVIRSIQRYLREERENNV
jgi:RNA polymerase sigma factor (sigma-70 family)